MSVRRKSISFWRESDACGLAKRLSQFRAMAVFSSDRRFYGRYLMIQTPRFSGLSSERRTRNLTRGQIDMNQIYPVEPTQLPAELKGVLWPPKS